MVLGKTSKIPGLYVKRSRHADCVVLVTHIDYIT